MRPGGVRRDRPLRERRYTLPPIFGSDTPNLPAPGGYCVARLPVGRFYAFRFVSRFLQTRSVRRVRILVSVKPNTYGQVTTLRLHHPESEVTLDPPWAVKGEAGDPGPYLIVRNGTDGTSSKGLEGVERPGRDTPQRRHGRKDQHSRMGPRGAGRKHGRTAPGRRRGGGADLRR